MAAQNVPELVKDFNEAYLKEIDDQIRQGRMPQAQTELRQISPKTVKREYAWDFADLARRAQLPLHAIKILNPIVRSEIPVHPNPSVKELSLYAALLAQIGARREARNILVQLDGKKNPEVYFYWLYVLLPEWDYRSAISPLKKYIKSNLISPYQRLIGRVNLAACYIYLKDIVQARRTLKIILEDATKQGANLIYGNALELSAQLAFIENNYLHAKQLLDEYISVMPGASHVYQLYAKKWHTLIDLKTTGLTSIVAIQLAQLRALATQLDSFETLRDLDYHEAQLTDNLQLRNLVFYGTPYAEYQKRIKLNLFKNRTPDTEIKFDIYERTLNNSDSYFSVTLGRSSDGKILLNPGKILYLCFKTLLKDLYQPVSIGHLFSELFRNEYFNPTTSTRRVLQTVYRLNLWFKKNSVPLSIACKNGQFKIVATDTFILSLSTDLHSSVEISPRLLQLKSRYSHRTFTSVMAARLLGLGQRQTQTLLSKWVKQKEIRCLSPGPHPGKNQRYSFTPKKIHKPESKKAR